MVELCAKWIIIDDIPVMKFGIIENILDILHKDIHEMFSVIQLHPIAKIYIIKASYLMSEAFNTSKNQLLKISIVLKVNFLAIKKN